MGYLGYDVVREIERLPGAPPDDLGHPDAALVVIGQFAAFDHWRQRIVLIDNVVVPDPETATAAELGGAAYEAACARLVELAADCARHPGGRRRNGRRRPVTASGAGRGHPDHVSSEEYQAAIGVAKEYIRAGDIFQVVLSQRFDLQLDADPFDVYRALRLLNPSPYLYFLRFPEVTVVGASPEPMVRLRDGIVTSRPDRRVAAAGRERAPRPPARGRAGRGSQGAGRAHHAGRPGPQRRRPGGRASAPRRWTSS